MKSRPLVVLCLFASCFGGANDNYRAVGNRDGGTQVGYGEVAVAKSGAHFFVTTPFGLSMGDVDARTLEPLFDIGHVDVLAFWAESQGDGLFVLTRGSKADHKPAVLVSYDLSARRVVWKKNVEIADEGIDVSADGNYVVLRGDDVSILSAKTGDRIGAVLADQRVVDVDLLGDRVIVTEATKWEDQDDTTPMTRVQVATLADAKVSCTIEAENCASELVVQKDGKQAFIAPSQCRRDPVSVIDLEQCQVRATLPGFGPIALTPDQRTAIAFMDNKREDPLAPPMPQEVLDAAERYHLMVFDTDSLTYKTLPIGDYMPRYAMTPNGARLVIDSIVGSFSSQDEKTPRNLQIVDVAQMQAHPVQMQGTTLMQEYVLSPDSSKSWILFSGFWELDLEKATAEKLKTPDTFSSLNITAVGDELIMRTYDGELYLFDVEKRTFEPFTKDATAANPPS